VSTDRIRIPGARKVRASLDNDSRDARAIVVACPPHPRRGGNRHDSRLRAVSAALPEWIDCLRVGYGPWDEGQGERADARAACEWAADRYNRIILFGYSFGGGVALLTAADIGGPVAALSPVASLENGGDVVAAVDSVGDPLWIGYGTRDETVDADRVGEAVRGREGTVETFPADHRFVGREATVGECVAAFVASVV
jgi:alpha/beta superfamily hydrolase